MKFFVILAVLGITSAQLAHHRPIQVQITEHNPSVNHRPIQIQTPPIEIVHRQPNFDETQQPGQVFPNFQSWNWQNEMPIRRFPEIFEVVDHPQPPFVFPTPIRPDQTFPWNGQLPVEQESGSPRWENNPRWGEQSPEHLPELEQEQPQWNVPRWNLRPLPEPEPEQPQWNIPRWNQRPQPQPFPEPEWNAPRWQPRPQPIPEPEQHIPRLPPWAMPQPEPELEPEVPRWGNNPRWNQRPEPEPLPIQRPQWPQPEPQPNPQFPQWPQFPEPQPESFPPKRPIMRPSPPQPELISPPVERPIWPQPPIRHPVAPRASWRDGHPDDRCPIPDDHEGYPVFLNGDAQWSFFICWGGIAWPFDCPEDTIFRPEVNVCADRAWNPVQMQPYFQEVQEVEQAVPYEAE
ncbi:uncharacterized protein [Chironomus tepperi]|uniref:uncharacterized protein n=1 Tax=Chironomus tepperi TaxID=113505 RepID=UPI00391FC22D